MKIPKTRVNFVITRRRILFALRKCVVTLSVASLVTAFAIWQAGPMVEPAYALSEWDDATKLSHADRCLAQAVYFEARGEPYEGQFAVAEVVMNRVSSPRYPHTVCGVVFENERRRHRCQFSFACDGRSDRPREARAWADAVRTAYLARSGDFRALTDEATHYHADYVSPYWSHELERTRKIGAHIFYRE
jgi:spore germination cell wall hydrolase CwlJ-like protein